MWWQIVTMPILGGAVGWLTNYLAIRMLFRPRTPWRALGLTIQGVIPQRRGELAERVAETIERDLFSHDDIREAVLHPEYLDALRPRVEDHLRGYLSVKLESSPRLLRALVGQGMVDWLARAAAQEMMLYVPSLLEGAASDLESRVNIGQVIREKINAFDLDRLEALVCEIAHRELRFIELLGGIVGAIVGALFAVTERLLS